MFRTELLPLTLTNIHSNRGNTLSNIGNKAFPKGLNVTGKEIGGIPKPGFALRCRKILMAEPPSIEGDAHAND